MKRQFLATVALATVIGFCARNALADTYSFSDTWIDWPGYTSNLSSTDENGTPKIVSMDVEVVGGKLMGVDINLSSSTRQLYDSLFINTSYDGSNWQQWNYF